MFVAILVLILLHKGATANTTDLFWCEVSNDKAGYSRQNRTFVVAVVIDVGVCMFYLIIFNYNDAARLTSVFYSFYLLLWTLRLRAQPAQEIERRTFHKIDIVVVVVIVLGV
jgi:hypothetical protein